MAFTSFTESDLKNLSLSLKGLFDSRRLEKPARVYSSYSPVSYRSSFPRFSSLRAHLIARSSENYSTRKIFRKLSALASFDKTEGAGEKNRWYFRDHDQMLLVHGRAFFVILPVHVVSLFWCSWVFSVHWVQQLDAVIQIVCRKIQVAYVVQPRYILFPFRKFPSFRTSVRFFELARAPFIVWIEEILIN